MFMQNFSQPDGVRAERYTDLQFETLCWSRCLGCMLGGAVGDALGYPIEFKTEEMIRREYGQNGIQSLEQAGTPAKISDDTQMSLFAANAYIYWVSSRGRFSEITLTDAVWLAYREWLGTQGDTSRMDTKSPKRWIYTQPGMHAVRAPGITCMDAISSSAKGGTAEHPVNNSKGCGTVMRAAVYGIMAGSANDRPGGRTPAAMAWEDAALTHGHPLAWGSSAWLAEFVRIAVYGKRREDARIEDSLKLISIPRETDPNGELRSFIERAVALANSEDISDIDAIHMLGKGAVGEEALAIALFCAIKHQRDFGAAIRAAVNHGGDSDSTGAICGNILGAWMGSEAVANAFNLDVLELRDVIETMAQNLFRAANGLTPEPREDPQWDKKYRV